MKDYCGNMGGEHKMADPLTTSIKQGSFNSGDPSKKSSSGYLNAKGILKSADKYQNTETFPIGSEGTKDGLSKLANDHSLTKNFSK